MEDFAVINDRLALTRVPEISFGLSLPFSTLSPLHQLLFVHLPPFIIHLLMVLGLTNYRSDIYVSVSIFCAFVRVSIFKKKINIH